MQDIERGIVRRASAPAKQFEALVVESDRAAFEQSIERARLFGQASRTRWEAMAPLRKLVESDTVAIEAVRKSAAARKALTPAQEMPVRKSPGGTPIPWYWNIDPGLNVFGPPYDGSRNGPIAGSPAQSEANRHIGEMTVTLPFDKNVEGHRAAEASVQLILDANQPGNLFVRPYIQYNCESLVTGQWLSAYSRGALFLSAARLADGGGAFAQEHVLWEHESDSLDLVQTDGAVSSSTLSVGVPIEPGNPVVVTLGARVSGNQSGDEVDVPLLFSFDSWSYFRARIWAKPVFVVAELKV